MSPPEAHFEGDCCPGLVYLKANYADHVSGAEGHNHKSIDDRLAAMLRQQSDMLMAIKHVEARIDTLAQRQWYTMGVFAAIVGILSFVGPDRIRDLFAEVLQYMVL